MTKLLPFLSLLLFCEGNIGSCTSNKYATFTSEGQTVYYQNDFIHSDDYPFSFKYGSQASSSLLSCAESTIRIKELNDSFQFIEKEWRLEEGLVVTLSVKRYLEYNAEEWITYISYKGKGRSKVISELYGIDNLFQIQLGNNVVIHTNKGDDCSKYSYEPYSIVLKRGQSEVFSPSQGGYPSAKSTTGPRGWPYWNVQNGNQGWIIAVGWPGTWQNEITRENEESIRVKAGQRTFKAALKPGETIRTPLICVLPWEAKDIETSQNIWRRFYIDHVIPRFDGEPEKPVTEVQTGQQESSKSYLQKYIDAGIKPRICWTDAGWYPTNTGDWLETGEWRLDPQKYPNGIKPFSSWAHQNGMESLLWFEPERVLGDNMLSKHHKDWLLSISGWETKTLNIGNSKCLDWLINHIDALIKDNGLDWYREDLNNSGPYQAWLQADQKLGKDRNGITENLYVQGHLAFWDTLKHRNPNLHIDACASGGRRNDLETMHRAVPLLRSDYQLPTMGEEYVIGNQAHTWALSAWFPFQGSASYQYDPYIYRSFYLPCFGMGWMTEEKEDVIIKAFNECIQIQPMMLFGDYWPMTPYSLESDDWISWQFNREKEGDGCVQAFRREDCKNNKINIKLRGLDIKANYIIRSFDDQKVINVSGKELMRRGLSILINEKPGSAVFIYEKVKL